MTAAKINNHNYSVSTDGEHIGWVTHRTALGATPSAPGWYFVAGDKRITNRFPDSATPSATWQAAMPIAA
jgi:hypothetical protein